MDRSIATQTESGQGLQWIGTDVVGGPQMAEALFVWCPGGKKKRNKKKRWIQLAKRQESWRRNSCRRQVQFETRQAKPVESSVLDRDARDTRECAIWKILVVLIRILEQPSSVLKFQR